MAKKDSKELLSEVETKVRILSQRSGDIICPDSTRVKYMSVCMVSCDTYAWLIASFKEFITKID